MKPYSDKSWDELHPFNEYVRAWHKVAELDQNAARVLFLAMATFITVEIYMIFYPFEEIPALSAVSFIVLVSSMLCCFTPLYNWTGTTFGANIVLMLLAGMHWLPPDDGPMWAGIQGLPMIVFLMMVDRFLGSMLNQTLVRREFRGSMG